MKSCSARRLSFAVADNPNGPPTVILRTRRVAVRSIGPANYRARQVDRLQNPQGLRQFVPPGRNAPSADFAERCPVHAVFQERRSASDCLADAGENGRFTPETVADEAFRPLEDWVDYIIDHDRKILQSWVQATQFDFEHFICTSDHDDKPKGPGSVKVKKRHRNEADDGSDALNKESIETTARTKGKNKTQQEDDAFVSPEESDRPSKDRENLDDLEKNFLEREGALDDSERLALWPQLAVLNTRLKLHDDAAICWLNVIWETPDPPIEWIWQWLHGEDPKAQRQSTSAEFDEHFGNEHPLLPALRAFVARILWCSCSASGIAFCGNGCRRLANILRCTNRYSRSGRFGWAGFIFAGSAVQMFLDWLAPRDRLLNRLLPPVESGTKGGLSCDRDLPRFLRSAGIADRARIKEVSIRANRLYQLAQKWGEDVPVNRPYFDLMFSFGFACLGEGTQAVDSRQSAAGFFAPTHSAGGIHASVHSLLLKAFNFRIEQAVGLPHQGLLPADILTAIDRLFLTQGRCPL